MEEGWVDRVGGERVGSGSRDGDEGGKWQRRLVMKARMGVARVAKKMNRDYVKSKIKSIKPSLR